MTSYLIGYGRKSSGEDDALSRARQEGAVRRFIEAEDDAELLDFVWERKVSGSKDWKKRELGEAMARVQRGEAAGIVVEEQSRLSRGDGLQTAEVWDAFQKAKARLVCTGEGLDTEKGDHELSFTMRAALAREQWKQYKRRSDAVKADRIGVGVFIGPAPTGYTKVTGKDATDEQKRLRIDPVMAPIVRELFEMRAQGHSWGDLVRHIEARTGRHWTQQGVTGIIRNPVYRGDLVYGKLENEGAHDAIVDAPLWHAAQRRGKVPARSGRKTDKWLLSGLLTCGSCGNSMIVWRGASQRNGRPRNVERRYRCTNRSCTARVSVDADRIEAFVPQTLWSLLGSNVREEHEAPDLTPLVEAVDTAQRRFDQAMAPEARDALGDLWAADVKDRRLELEAAQALLGDAVANDADVEAEIIDLRERWDTLEVAERRERLSQYAVKRVIVNGKNPADWELVLR